MTFFIVTARLLSRWESRCPMDGHFSEKINILNNCIQRFVLAIVEIFRYLCTHNCRKPPCMLLRPFYGDKVGPYKNFGLPLFKSWLKAWPLLPILFSTATYEKSYRNPWKYFKYSHAHYAYILFPRVRDPSGLCQRLRPLAARTNV